MADKIVQLEDEDGNNIFPLCRGLGNNTVTTAAIQDGAVTNAKIGSEAVKMTNIDWSSITEITSASTIFSETNYTVSSFKAYKIGRLLILERLQFASHSSTTSGRQVATLKSEYRPTNSMRIPVQHGSTESPHLGLVQDDGKLVEYAPNNITQDSLWYSGVWICSS